MKYSRVFVFYHFYLSVCSSLDSGILNDDFELKRSVEKVRNPPQEILTLFLSDNGNRAAAYDILKTELQEESQVYVSNQPDLLQDSLNNLQKRFDYQPNNNEVETSIDVSRPHGNGDHRYGLLFNRLPFRPRVRVEMRLTNPFTQENSAFKASVSLRPGMDIVGAIFSAALQQHLRHPTKINPFNVIIDYNLKRRCDAIISALDVPNMRASQWRISVTRRRGKVVYDDVCLSKRRRQIRLKPGTTVKIYYK